MDPVPVLLAVWEAEPIDRIRREEWVVGVAVDSDEEEDAGEERVDGAGIDGDSGITVE